MHAHRPARIVGEPETRCAILLLRLEQGELVIAPRPELPRVVTVGVGLFILLDRGRAVRDVEVYSGSILYSADGPAVSAAATALTAQARNSRPKTPDYSAS